MRKDFEKHKGSKHIIKFIDKFRLGKFGYIVQELGQFNMSKLVSDITGIFHNNERVYEVTILKFRSNSKIFIEAWPHPTTSRKSCCNFVQLLIL